MLLLLLLWYDNLLRRQVTCDFVFDFVGKNHFGSGRRAGVDSKITLNRPKNVVFFSKNQIPNAIQLIKINFIVPY